MSIRPNRSGLGTVLSRSPNTFIAEIDMTVQRHHPPLSTTLSMTAPYIAMGDNSHN